MLVQVAPRFGVSPLGGEELLDRRFVRGGLDSDEDLPQRQRPAVEVTEVSCAVHAERALDDLLVLGEEPDEG